MIEEIIEISIILFLLVLSFIFSGSEVSIFSISEIEKAKLSRIKNRKNRLLLNYLNLPEKALVTILVGNMVVNLSASIIGERLSNALFVNHPLFYSVFIMTFLVLLFGEIVPKKIAASKPTVFAKRCINIIETARKVFFPLIFLMNKFIKAGKDTKSSSVLSKDELLSAFEVSSNAGLNNISIKILKNLISHIDKPVTDIMIPRSDIQAIDIGEYWNAVEDFIKVSPFSTVLFYRGNIDNIMGYSLKTDLINVRKKSIKERLRELFYIPESKTIFSLLSDFKKRNEFIAIILDEYGGTAGLITLKDILDSIFIQDMRIKYLIQEKGKGSWSIHGNAKISDLNSMLYLDLPTESNTISGYIINRIGSIPKEGSRWNLIKDYTFTIRKSDNRQIELLELKKIDS